MTIPLNPQSDFNEITQLIHAEQLRAMNTALIELYWQVGQFISRKIERVGIMNDIANRQTL